MRGSFSRMLANFFSAIVFVVSILIFTYQPLSEKTIIFYPVCLVAVFTSGFVFAFTEH